MKFKSALRLSAVVVLSLLGVFALVLGIASIFDTGWFEEKKFKNSVSAEKYNYGVTGNDYKDIYYKFRPKRPFTDSNERNTALNEYLLSKEQDDVLSLINLSYGILINNPDSETLNLSLLTQDEMKKLDDLDLQGVRYTSAYNSLFVSQIEETVMIGKVVSTSYYDNLNGETYTGVKTKVYHDDIYMPLLKVVTRIKYGDVPRSELEAVLSSVELQTK